MGILKSPNTLRLGPSADVTGGFVSHGPTRLPISEPFGFQNPGEGWGAKGGDGIRPAPLPRLPVGRCLPAA